MSRVSIRHDTVRHVLCDNRSGSDDNITSDREPRQHDSAGSNKSSITNLHTAGNGRSGSHVNAGSHHAFVINARSRVDDAAFANPDFGTDGRGRENLTSVSDLSIPRHKRGGMSDSWHTDAARTKQREDLAPRSSMLAADCHQPCNLRLPM